MAAAASEDRPMKRARTEGVAVPQGICSFYHIDDWYEQNKDQFAPPVCNKLMHKGQLNIMFVGGPNTRKDFHLEAGAEFFFQMRGHMELPTVQKGKRKLVKINEGHIFCLPPCIPHSPQRPMSGSFGLVIERCRQEVEMDGLLYYTDFENCDKVEWEKFFKCKDLATDLPPVIKDYQEWKASEASKHELEPREETRPIQQDKETGVPPPFLLQDFLLANAEKLDKGKSVPLLGNGHPDNEFIIFAVGGPSQHPGQVCKYETWLYQIKGTAHVAVQGGTLALIEGCCCIVEPDVSFDVARDIGSVGLVLQQQPQNARKIFVTVDSHSRVRRSG